MPLLGGFLATTRPFQGRLESTEEQKSSGEQKDTSSDGLGANLGSNVPVAEENITKSMLPELDDAFKGGS